MKKVKIYTDGACKGNPGPGGWGAILSYKGMSKKLSGGEKNTTNNRMELSGVIESLKSLKEVCEVDLYSDSKYVCDALSKGWAKKWKQNGWKRSSKEPALNVDLWDELLNLYDKHKVNVYWVKGHAGHKENEECDRLAVKAAEKFQ